MKGALSLSYRLAFLKSTLQDTSLDLGTPKVVPLSGDVNAVILGRVDGVSEALLSDRASCQKLVIYFGDSGRPRHRAIVAI